MRTGLTCAALWAGLLAGTLCPAFAQEATAASPAITLSGTGIKALRVTPATLSSLPQVEQDVAFQSSKGEVRGRYEGVLLWDVLQEAGIGEAAGHHGELKRTFVVTGRDGYAVAFSVGEIGPDFGDKPIMIALRVDGRPLPLEDGLRLIVPGDKRGARSVRDVVTIEMR